MIQSDIQSFVNGFVAALQLPATDVRIAAIRERTEKGLRLGGILYILSFIEGREGLLITKRYQQLYVMGAGLVESREMKWRKWA